MAGTKPGPTGADPPMPGVPRKSSLPTTHLRGLFPKKKKGLQNNTWDSYLLPLSLLRTHPNFSPRVQGLQICFRRARRLTLPANHFSPESLEPQAEKSHQTFCDSH